MSDERPLDREWFEKLHRACQEALKEVAPDAPHRPNLELFCADLEAKMLAAPPGNDPD